MSGEPLWRGPLGELFYAIEEAVRGHRDIDGDLEVWRAGDRPVPPTREEVEQAVRSVRSEHGHVYQALQEGSSLPGEIADAVVALLSGVPTAPEEIR